MNSIIKAIKFLRSTPCTNYFNHINLIWVVIAILFTPFMLIVFDSSIGIILMWVLILFQVTLMRDDELIFKKAKAELLNLIEMTKDMKKLHEDGKISDETYADFLSDVRQRFDKIREELESKGVI